MKRCVIERDTNGYTLFFVFAFYTSHLPLCRVLMDYDENTSQVFDNSAVKDGPPSVKVPSFLAFKFCLSLFLGAMAVSVIPS